MKNILVPTDFSTAASNAMDVAFDIAKRRGAGIVLLHVVEEAESESYNISGEVTEESGENRLFTFKLLEKGRKKLTEFINNPAYEEVEVVGELRLGNAFHGITSIIAEQNVDLVVMGVRGHSAAEEIILGSTTEKVVRRCKKPVLTV
ncbi:MAG: universal stress protein, partial [Candidatus Nephrothrix sp. EaCA]